ncbi:hypothetical protein KJ641_01010 [Patescibacteria group bacterium]|nr:hypothetical protein [Patescibacteria group bacterium]MBU1895438.1 hypothetical protein [Patescibacteria group bacterium]
MLIKDLEKLGFSKNLATVYLTLFELGEAKAGELVRRTGMHRNLVYTALDKLEGKKLIAKTQIRGVSHYKMLDSSRLKGEIDNMQKIVDDVVVELKSQYKVNSQEVVIYEGKEEVQRMYLESAKKMPEGSVWYVLGLAQRWFDVMEDLVYKFKEIQRERKFLLRGVSDHISQEEEEMIEVSQGLSEFRVVPSISKKDSEINITEDKVLIFILVEPYTVIEIFNKDLVEGYKEYFNVLWKQEVKTFVGWEEVKKFYYEILLPSNAGGNMSYCIGGGYGVGGEDQQVLDFYLEYARARAKVKAKAKILFYEQHRDKARKEFTETGDPDLKYNELKFLPQQYYSPLQIFICGKIAAVVHWGKEPSVTLYERPEIVESFKKQFDLLWDQEVRTYSGKEEVKNLFLHVLLEDMEEGDTEYVIGAGYGLNESEQWFADMFVEHNSYLIQHKANKKALFCEKHRERIKSDVQLAGDPEFEYFNMKFLSDKLYSPLEIHIFPKKVTVTYFGDNPVSTLYENPGVVEGFKKQFDMLWGVAND